MNHYTLSGSDKEGWKLDVYQYIDYPHGGGETITVKWPEPKTFDKFEQVINEFDKLREEENGLLLKL